MPHWQEPDPHVPHLLQGVSASESEPGKFAIHDAVEPLAFCGRNCAFRHAAKAGVNLEHARRYTSSVWHDTVTPGAQVIPGAYARKGADQREVEDSSAVLRPATGKHDREWLDAQGHCANCGKAL